MNECTGSPNRLSKRLELSRTTLYEIIDELKNCGIEIEYSRVRQTYYYVHPECVEISLKICQHPCK